MIKKIAFMFGVIFLLIGILGLIPGATTTTADGMQLLLGLFMVDGTHNAIHIASGVAALLAASSERYAKWYLQIFGLVYALVALIGFVQGDSVLGLFAVNPADNWLHTILALGLLGAGFGINSSAPTPTTPTSTLK
ncbi:MAG TPA: DUF4383 domain-containing protein [Candidatus Saccharimonadales bacterium]|nr:DUF4383 domain-containing protein [Candidatus Saccharimonadales bacterium]